MAWYDNPTIAAVLGGIAGAIAGAALTAIWQNSKKIRRVDCIINDVSSLLSFAETISNELEVTYKGERASSVLLFNIEIFNSGNLAIGKQPVKIRLDRDAKIVGYSLKTEPDVGFGEIEKSLTGNALDISIELLNPKDRVAIEIISVNNNSDKIDVYMKNANVNSRVYTRRDTDIYETLLPLFIPQHLIAIFQILRLTEIKFK